MQITFDRKFVNGCLQQKFVLPTYQRGYQWESKHLEELLTDVQESFLASWKQGHGRKDVLGYEQYFLGTIITTLVGQGGKAIVDGQQRITTLTLLLAYVHRMYRKQPGLNISPVDQSIRRKVAGQSEFNLDMDPPRQQFFDLLMDGPDDDEELAAKIDSIPHKDPGTERLWLMYGLIDKFIASEIRDNGLLPHFFDYLTECVCMFEIGVPREQDGHKVFVTMNDRGLKLSPIDLLKGFLLSSITTNEENHEAHASWVQCIKKLKELGSDEDSNFFKTWLRAKYAVTMRGKKRGDAPGDFELIGESYHRWVMENKEVMGLNTSDDFYNLLTGTLPYYVELYCRIKSAEKEFHDSLPHLYFNGVRDLTLQAMVVLSSVQHSDTSAVSTKKLKAISYYLDYLATVRVLNGKENTYDNVRDLIFDLTKEIRNLGVDQLSEKLLARIDAEADKVESIVAVGYGNLKRADLLHLLARLSDYLERALDAANKVSFADYVDRTKDSKTFDVEHLLADKHADANAAITALGGTAFPTPSDFAAARNLIGGLVLLPRGRNRSMKDMAYADKLERYAGENALAQTLTQNFYKNQPNWVRFTDETGIKCDPLAFIDGAAIAKRNDFYLQLAGKIWSRSQLEAIFK
jgi:uncharacterized protein with ParB-like and HNH nuclease domain